MRANVAFFAGAAILPAVFAYLPPAPASAIDAIPLSEFADYKPSLAE